jgi:hypothetical protein
LREVSNDEAKAADSPDRRSLCARAERLRRGRRADGRRIRARHEHVDVNVYVDLDVYVNVYVDLDVYVDVDVDQHDHDHDDHHDHRWRGVHPRLLEAAAALR